MMRLSANPPDGTMQQERDIFFEALERHGAERAAFLREACGNDEPLRKRVERLLEADARSGGDADRNTTSMVLHLVAEDSSGQTTQLGVEPAGTRIGLASA